MSEAHAQTAEIIGAAGTVANAYIDKTDIVAGTWAIVAVGLIVLLGLIYRRLEKRDAEITQLKVDCAQEIAAVEKACLEKNAEYKAECDKQLADERSLFRTRDDQKRADMVGLYAKYDTLMDKVIGSIQTIKDEVTKLSFEVSRKH